ncbi:hypothetical protein EVAR_13341_1 [Eumeta japonica]|uniref:RNA-directed DNA polymerase from mobile element jockey n=1 Tax=Eumeta variegata TaxID=151549 RepID=A0A4C1TRU6_EUMVA|nr:hypothetical protein EVAR_13341_1 [Eumeta japonica]
MEATGCRLTMTVHSVLIIISVYLSSPKRLLRRDLRALLALGDAVILSGQEIIAPSTATYLLDDVRNRPSTLDIALTKRVALNLNRIETLHDLSSDHRPVILKMGPPDSGRPIPTLEITDWKRASTTLEKIDTLLLNSMLDDISTTDEIDSAIDALTSHVKTVVR